MADAYNIDALIAEIGNTESGKTSYPEFPSEKPTKATLTVWIDSWKEDLNAKGYSAILRNHPSRQDATRAH